MSRRRIWLIIIGILMAGVSATWEMEKFVSSHGVNTAAVVGFEADAMQPDAGNSGNPYMTENRMKVAENTPQPRMRQLRRAALPITGSPCTTRMQKAAGDRKMGEKLLILKQG